MAIQTDINPVKSANPSKINVAVCHPKTLYFDASDLGVLHTVEFVSVYFTNRAVIVFKIKSS